ncbi:taurine ABC transporter substrate-binding protein [Corticibacter populi]|uniref:Taurine ABC transporter substrate-binding protein n=2 Tax=Corticibacter populi TaxID=1550736 RepID=A0A3M6QPA7_9BURK|nr:taurine ABC transporter substrate-binding protein [Corticibacter populi]
MAVVLAAAALASSANVWAQEGIKEVRFAWAGGPRAWVLGQIDKSFDQAFGVPVKWVGFNSGADVLSLFAAKEIDIARFGSSPAAAGIARKLPIEVIGTPEIIATAERLIVKNGIASIKDLEDKRVAYPANSTAQFAFELAVKLDGNGADRSKIRTVALKPAEIVSAWQRGDIDAAYVWGPFSQQLEAADGKEIYATQNLARHGVLVFNNFVARKEFAEKNPELIVKFLQVAQQKIDEYTADPEAASQKIAKHLDIPVDTVRSTLGGLQYPSIQEQLTPDYLGDSHTKASSRIARSYQEAAEFLAAIGELRKSDVPASYAGAINTRYLEEAAKAGKN